MNITGTSIIEVKRFPLCHHHSHYHGFPLLRMSVGWAVASTVAAANANLPSLSFLHNLATLLACCTACKVSVAWRRILCPWCSTTLDWFPVGPITHTPLPQDIFILSSTKLLARLALSISLVFECTPSSLGWAYTVHDGSRSTTLSLGRPQTPFKGVKSHPRVWVNSFATERLMDPQTSFENVERAVDRIHPPLLLGLGACPRLTGPSSFNYP
ncbi:hypothetical protein MGG_17460 [Pyricularia oryzae 70-15]|uniref:Uncharacterized protein n=3 Tax=Pyricularia oryzae TaxID=318829 RepID=G4NCC7_PYRO7|nr:uncharacterized protein MGG_17460 [Pyricularia oryzae 70-15]EHA49076.1 hypothetical protein MGG_17460 [Pyricularia oryzae 70-15]ELQ42618.1 hypothetical protein OOU_Y34scaffold00203g107 [Pyricularia oryzae Y34]